MEDEYSKLKSALLSDMGEDDSEEVDDDNDNWGLLGGRSHARKDQEPSPPSSTMPGNQHETVESAASSVESGGCVDSGGRVASAASGVESHQLFLLLDVESDYMHDHSNRISAKEQHVVVAPALTSPGR